MEKALKYLGLCSGGTYGKAVQGKLLYDAKHAYYMLRGIILIYGITMLLLPEMGRISFLAGNLSGAKMEIVNGTFIFGMALLIITLFFIAIDVIWEVKKGKNYGLYGALGFLYVTVVILSTCEMMLSGQMEESGLIIYIVTLLIVSALAVLEPWQSIAVFGMASALCSVNSPFSSVQPLQVFRYEGMDSLFVSLAALAISLYLNGHRARIYRKQEMIEEQNKRLSEVNERLSRENSRDSLTGLYNRRYLTDIVHPRFHESIDRMEQRPLSCLMLDVDYFKQYNDTYGHPKGDECLVRISEIMKECLPMEFAKIIRYGGEEFLIFIFNCDERQALSYAEGLRKAVEESKFMKADDSSSHLTVSIGLCTDIPGGISNLEMRGFIRKADEALYEAKGAGRNCVRVYRKGRA